MNRLIFNRAGFSLVEVLIAIAILGVFIIPVSGMLTSSLKVSESSRASIEAYAIANKVIEAMGNDELFLESQNAPLSASEYQKHGIKNIYEVTRTVAIEKNDIMDSFADLAHLEANNTLLIIDASVEGRLDFPNISAPPLTYSPEFKPDVARVHIRFDNSSVKSGETNIAIQNFDHVKVIGGDANLILTLENSTSDDKALYVSNLKTDGAFSINTVVTSSGNWTSYDNMASAEANRAGSVATANITISVRHKPTDRKFTVTTKRVFYKYEH